jgi:hypothetical protein
LMNRMMVPDQLRAIAWAAGLRAPRLLWSNDLRRNRGALPTGCVIFMQRRQG